MIDPAALAEQLEAQSRRTGVVVISGGALRTVLAALRNEVQLQEAERKMRTCLDSPSRWRGGQAPAARIAAQVRRYSDGAV